MIRNYFKTAIRNLIHNKIYSLINIGGLSLGLSCAMLIALYIKDEVSYDRFHEKANQIYRIDRKIERPNGSVDNSSYTGLFQGPRFTENIPEIKEFIRFEPSQTDMKNGTNVQSQPVYLTDPNFFSVFTFPLLKGDPKTALEQTFSVVITEDIAKRQFGTTDALGKIILFKDGDHFVPYSVTGVAKNCPQNSSINFQVLMPLKVSRADENKNDNWFNFSLNTFVVLTPNSGLKATETKMQKVFESDAGETIKLIKEKYNIKSLGISYFLQSLASIHLSKEVPAEDQAFLNVSKPVYSYVLSGIAFFILLIACINFVNLTIARSLKRAKEIGIRKVIGGSRKQLIIQFLGESMILCSAAFIFAVILVQLMLPLFNQLSGKMLMFSYLLDAKLIVGYAIIFLVTGFLAGFYPALVLSGYNPVQTLYRKLIPGGKNYLQKSLVVMQFALASFLIIATLTIFSQFNYLTTQKQGYDDRNLVMVPNWGMSHSMANLFKRKVMENTGITDVAFKNNGYSGNTVKVNGSTEVNITYETIDASYLPLLNVPVVEGRNFSAAYPSDSLNSVLVNETFVQEAGWKQPIGQQVDFLNAGNKYTVVGVIKDYHFRPLTEKITPQVFTMNPASDYGMFYLKIKPGTEIASLRFIEQTFKNIFPLTAYSYNFKSEENRLNYAAEAKWKQIMLFGALITIFISCIGLFGLSVLSAEKRTKEIGIRKVLGTSVSNVVVMLTTDFLKLVFIAFLISFPLAWMAASRWLQNYPYRISLDWKLFASAGFMLVLIALATVSFQAIKSAIINPVKALRTD